MTFKNPSEVTDLWVTIEVSAGVEIRVPSVGLAGSLSELVQLTVNELANLDAQGHNMVKPLLEQANAMGLQYQAFMSVVIENMICKRFANPDQKCYMDGAGDTLLIASGKIDNAISKLPTPLRAIATSVVQAATKIATGKASKTLKGCQTCGGSITVSTRRSLLGRAGKLNKITAQSINRKRLEGK